jgi:hypothetical protein
MPAQVQVLRGPDRGWRYTILSSGAKIGRGNGHTIPLTDPGWPDGSLAISQRGGGYLLANQMPHPVYLDGHVLPPDEVRTFHHGMVLQPTADTCLLLTIVEAPKGPAPASGVLVTAPEQPKKDAKRTRNIMLGMLVVVFMLLAVNSRMAAAAEEIKLMESSLALKDALWSLQAEKGIDRKFRPQILQAHKFLASGFYEETLGEKDRAKESYRQARDELEKLGQNLPNCQAVKDAKAFVLERLEIVSR